ncbi:hypothetical protein KI387_013749 [Taxus chinensis]|uniref:Protein kinase domain-containing protein n=1 Tax=Taxus chinensis TaxID=29808 RepID=A0AA38CIT9_TAXCH|nr:hypothetical protein KI387_013749 [Taxus chinensis]
MLKRRIYALMALLPVLICTSYAQRPSGNGTSFSFSNFGQNNSQQLIYMGNASFSAARGYIDLTPDPNATTHAASSNRTAPNLALQNCIGRVLYRNPVTVWPASFTTTFTLLVRNITTNAAGAPTNFNGDGVAFIIVPNKERYLPDSHGSFLGLFSSDTNGNTTGQLAIEFDTFKNEFDPDNNHVGIDIEGIKSNATANMGEHGMFIRAGRPITVRVTYDGWTKNLQISAGYADNTSGIRSESLLNRTVELQKTVPRSAYVGFSAATGLSYEVHRILDWNFSSLSLPESSLNLSPVGTPGGSGGGVKVGVVAGSVSAGVAVVGIATWLVYKTMKRKRKAAVTRARESFSGELAMIGSAPHRFPYKQLLAATKNFSDTELLGTGGFGSVYRGNLKVGGDEEGQWLAVKRISAGSKQGEREFVSEITTIGRLRHRNLVQLQGWCHEQNDLLLVYDYMPNGSLDKILFDRTADPPLNWRRRHRILCGLASALLYLHEEWEQRVVHRDVKPSNVMLDAEFNARLGDFGLARLIEHDDTNPAVTTRLAGTPGYVAPECGYTGKATAESDVFSFGIVLLEVATGRRAVERKSPLGDGNLVDWVWGKYSEGDGRELRRSQIGIRF